MRKSRNIRGELQVWTRAMTTCDKILLTKFRNCLVQCSQLTPGTLYASRSSFTSGGWNCEGRKSEPSLTRKLLDEAERPAQRLPPWQSVPSVQLSERLANYRQELRLGRSRYSVDQQSQQSVLPFLEDALVGSDPEVYPHGGGVVNHHGSSAAATAAVAAAALWKPWSKVNNDDEAQSLLAARANDIISVLMTIERLVPLAPWQRRAISYAIGESKLPSKMDEGKHASAYQRQSPSSVNSFHRLVDSVVLSPKNFVQPRPWMEITARTALLSITFLLEDCLISEEAVANLMANHPWVLGLQNPKASCGQFIESLRLIDMPLTAIAEVVSRHPSTLLADVERDVLPLLEYLTNLGLSESESGALVSKAPWLLEQGGKDELAGWVAFWTGRGMQKSRVLALIARAPKAISGSLQLTQLKLDWLMENADFVIDDIAHVPAAIELPLATHVGPRVAFVKRLSSFAGQNTSWTFMSNEQRELLLCMNETDFLSVLQQTAVEFHAFEGAWVGSEFRDWLQSQKPTEDLVSHYDSLEWLGSDDMAEMREVHDRYLMRHDEAWEQQQDREREWKNVWQAWRRIQERREKADMNARQLKRRREEAASVVQLRRLLTSKEDVSPSQDSRKLPDSYSISEVNRIDPTSSPSVSMSPIEKLFHRGILGATTPVSQQASLSGHDLSRGRGPAVGVHSLNRKALLAEEAVLNQVQQQLKDAEHAAGKEIVLEKVDITDRGIQNVHRCVDAILSLLSCTEYGVLTPLAVNSWCLAQGFSKSCIANAKGIISSRGSACVVAEPLWRYHNAAPLAWVLLLHPRCLNLSNEFQVGNLNDMGGPRPVLTGGAASVLRVVGIVLSTIKQASDDSPLLRSELDKLCHDMNGFRIPSKHMSSAISALIEEGRILRQRQKGVPSGPMELRLIDLQKYNDSH